MSRFRFRLQALLTARLEAERDRQRVVAELERGRRRLEDTLRRQQQFISTGKDTLRDQLIGELDVACLRDHAGTTLRLMREAQRMVIELAGVHRRLDAARLALVEATRQRRALELLRERRFAAWKRRRERMETAELDEVAQNLSRAGVSGRPIGTADRGTLT